MQNKNINWNRRCACNLTLILLFVAGMGLMMLATPRMLDDYWYIFQLRPWFESQGMSPFPPESGGDVFGHPGLLDGIRQVWLDHYYTDNIRLGNMLAPFLLVIPMWISKSISILMLAWMIFLSFRLSGIDWWKSSLVPLGIVCFMFGIPWVEHIVVLDFQLNYIYPSALALWLLNLLNIDSVQPGSILPLKLAGILLLSFIVGGWHEGISVPILGGLVALTLFKKNCRSWRFIFAEIGLVLGIIYLFSSPGMRLRTGNEVIYNFTLGHLMAFVMTGILFFLSVGVLIWQCRKNRSLLYPKQTKIVFLLVSCFISLLISLKVNMPARAAWWCELGSIILLLLLLRLGMVREMTRSLRRTVKVVVWLGLVVGFVRIGVADSYAIKFRRYWGEYLTTYAQEPKKNIFGKVYEPSDISILAGYLPFRRFPNDHLMWIDVYTRKYGEKQGGLCAVVPEELRYVRNDSGSPIAGNSGVRIKDGFLFMPYEGEVPYSASFMIDFGFGARRVPVRMIDFVSEADGRRYVYISLFANMLDHYLGRLRSFNGPMEVVHANSVTANHVIKFYK